MEEFILKFDLQEMLVLLCFKNTDDFEENISPKIGLSYNFSISTVASISWG